MIIINFKNYKTGKEALKLAKTIEKYLPNAIIAVPTVDIEIIASKTNLKVIAQHADPKEGDKTTGFNILKALKKVGAKGSLINHSEHPLSAANIYKLGIQSKKLGLKTIVCASTLRNFKTSLNNKKVKPHAIAFEDPSLVGTGKSITQYKSHDIERFVKIMKRKNIISLCGAGISTAEDVKQAYKLGCKGVLIASAIANSKNPIPLLKELRKLQ